MSERARSLPPQGNPFWSGRALAEFRLEQARPVDLPVPHGDDDLEESSEAVPVEDQGLRSPGKRVVEQRGREVPIGGRRMATPPSSWETPGGEPRTDHGEEFEVPASGVEGQPSQGTDASALQQALGESVVDFLAQENARLREELARAKEKEEKAAASGRSWSEVSGTSGMMKSEGRMPMETPKRPMKTEGVAPERIASVGIGPPPWAVGDETRRQEVRYTPGGTKIPEGPPPEREELPPIPPPPTWLEAEWDIYQKEEASKRFRLGDVQWEPQQQMEERKLLSPREARMVWLEREVRALHSVLDQQPRSALNDGYWRQPVHRWERLEGEVIMDGQLGGLGRAEVCQDGRAPGIHEVCQDGRAPGIQGVCQDVRAPGIQGVCQEVRAPSRYGAHELCQDGRASYIHGVCHDARAPSSHEVYREGRASSNHGVCPGDRAFSNHEGCREGQAAGGQVGHVGGKRERCEDGFEDMLRSFPIKLPMLPDPGSRHASLEAGDWLTQVRPLVGDVSARAGSWWDDLLQRVNETYLQWLEASPLERLRVKAPTDALEGRQSERLAQRVTTMLLESLPSTLRGELIATRKLNVCEILFQIHKVYQPGGTAERQQMLQALMETKSAVSPRGAVEALRLWKRQCLRCVELKLSLPDALLRIQALDRIMVGLLSKDLQVSFRVSTYRLQNKIDVKPTEEGVTGFFDLLLAEAENMMIAGRDHEEGKQEESNKPAVKSVLSPNKEKAVNACKWWGSEQGCRAGRSCKFSHDQVLADKASRCWLCSAKDHRKSECPTRSLDAAGKEHQDGGAQDRSRGGAAAKGDSYGNGKGKGKTKKGSDQQEKGPKKESETDGAEEKKNVDAAETEQGKGDGQTGGSSGNGGGEALLAEVTHLLKSIRVPHQEGPQLRAYRVCRVEGPVEQKTLLDGGATHCMRTAEKGEWSQSLPVKVQLASEEVEMRMHPVKNTLLVQHSVQPIVPLGKLTLVGYVVKWEEGKIEVSHPIHGKLPVHLQQGCPVVEQPWGRKLMAEVEDHELRKVKIKAVMAGVHKPDRKEDYDAAKLKKMFPDVPQEILEKVQGKWDYDPSQLPFNRHRRRQIAQARTVVINLFAGKDVSGWKKEERNGVVIVNLDVLSGSDLVKNQHLVGWLQMMAESGKVDLWTAGPPCRTVSACRSRGDSGPPPLRDRDGQGRFGKHDLTAHQRQQVDEDTLMWLRTMWWFRLSKEAEKNKITEKKTSYFLEQPLDPEEWMRKEGDPRPPFASFMVWLETRATMTEVGLQMVRADQGALGHATRKPSMFATDVQEIISIDQLRCDSYVAGQPWGGTLAERIAMSKSLAQWAPGLCALLVTAIRRINEQKKVAVNVLTVKEKREIQGWQDHYRCGHLPFRNDCPTCLIGAGRSKQHRRVLCPSSYCLSLDIMGPFKEGVDQEIQGPKYALVAVYTVPMAGDGSPLPEGLASLRSGAVEKKDLVEGELEKEDEDQPEPFLEEQDPLTSQQEEDAEQQLPEMEAKRQEINERKWKEFLQDRRAVPVKNLTVAVPLRSRAAGDVLKAVSKVYARMRTMRLPIVRLHTDRAREFSGSTFQGWCESRDIFHTMTSGDDPTSNSRAEREVAWVKGRARTLIQAAKSPFHMWPLAIRHASEERLRMQVREMGINAPALIPFGTKVVVKKKAWHHREDDSGMKWPMKRAVLWGPASDMSMSSCGYYLQDDEGRFFRSTVVHQVHDDEEQAKEDHGKGIRNDAPGNAEEAPWDVGKDQPELLEKEHRKGEDDEHGAKGEAMQRTGKKLEIEPVLELEEVVDQSKKVGAIHDPPRRRYLVKSAPIQHDDYKATLFKVSGQEARKLEKLALKQHVAAREWSQELTECIQEGMAIEDDVNEIKRINEETLEIEHVLKQCQVKQQEEEEKKMEVTQTKLVSMDDVRKDLESWKPVFKEEVEKLVKTALEPIDEVRFRELLQGDVEVECLPMKAIASIKPEKRKARIVVCGNFAKEKEGEALDNAASGIDSVAIRTVLNAAAHRGWSAGTTDVASAFLQAPRRTNDRRITICQPPSILRSMNLVGSQERWVIHQALHGLQESPGDWGWFRDCRLSQMQWEVNGSVCTFEETAERHLWRIKCHDQPEQEVGFLMVYVDDMMLVGQEDHLRGAMDAVRGEWKCSDPEWLSSEKSMRFCGFEIRKSGEDICLHQEGYTLNLIQKRKVVGVENVPLPKIKEEEEPEQFSMDDIRAAQTLVGEVLWLSTRTRPDVSFAVGALGRMLHKRPQYTLRLGEHLMRYLNQTKHWGLRYQKCKRGDLGEADQEPLKGWMCIRT